MSHHKAYFQYKLKYWKSFKKMELDGSSGIKLWKDVKTTLRRELRLSPKYYLLAFEEMKLPKNRGIQEKVDVPLTEDFVIREGMSLILLYWPRPWNHSSKVCQKRENRMERQKRMLREYQEKFMSRQA